MIRSFCAALQKGNEVLPIAHTGVAGNAGRRTGIDGAPLSGFRMRLASELFHKEDDQQRPGDRRERQHAYTVSPSFQKPQGSH
jgi:hypothetical protein